MFAEGGGGVGRAGFSEMLVYTCLPKCMASSHNPADWY